jgi:protein TonB
MSMDLPVPDPAPHAGALPAPRPEDCPQRRPPRRVAAPLWTAGVLSIAAHLALGGSILLGLHPGRHMAEPDTMGAVELLMVEKQGAGPAQPQTQPAPPAQTPPQQQAPPTPREAKTEPAPDGRPTAPEAEGEPVPSPAPAPAPPPVAAETPAEQPKQAQQDQPSPATQPAPEAKPEKLLTFNLDGTDSLSNAEVSGDHVIPASPDDRFRNRPPVYPREAVLRGERGVVVLVIHVSERGVWAGSEVAESSGHAALDQAAQEAVRSWRFRPALRDGRAVPFDMPMRFIFEAN